MAAGTTWKMIFELGNRLNTPVDNDIGHIVEVCMHFPIETPW